MSSQSLPPRRGANPVLLAVVAALIVAAVAAVAIVAAGGGDDDGDAGRLARAQGTESESEGNGAAPSFDFDTATATVDGVPLPVFPEAGNDAAIGMDAPVVTGWDPTGTDLTIPASGRPTMVLFLAHWCPHCQQEIKEARDWVEAGNLPDDVDLVGVATAIDPARPNHPPSDWFVDEDWRQPTIADADAAVSHAYGLTQFPYWVIVAADGTVVDRRVGVQSDQQLDAMSDLALDDA